MFPNPLAWLYDGDSSRMSTEGASSARYAIPCKCGESLTGLRQSTPQIITCPRCRARRFVYPLSSYPSLASNSLSGVESIPGQPEPKSASPRSSPVKLLIALGMVFFAALAVIVGGLFLFPEQTPNSTPRPAPPGEKEIRAELARVDQYVEQGHFSLAHKTLEEALERNRVAGDFLVPGEQAYWHRRGREIDLFADLLEQPLEEILAHAVRLPDEEWQANFRQRYQGKAVLFETDIVWNRAGRLQTTYKILARGEEAILALDSVGVIQNLGKDAPKRILFAGRLESIHRTQPGQWTIELTPGSSLLITDPDMARICCPPLGDPPARELIREQARLVRDREFPANP